MPIKKYKNVYQFKITLKDIKPPVWRRIQVPEDYSFWDLHIAIQDSMGWLDGHLHEFTTIEKNYKERRTIGLPDIEFMEHGILPDWKEAIKDWFSMNKCKIMDYTYDFGDNWEHEVELEKIIPREVGVKYPVCIAGKRACPPEDSGGTWGYEEKLKILNDPSHPEHDEIVEWMGDNYDSEYFDCSEVHFDNPAKRLKMNGIAEEYEKISQIINEEKDDRKDLIDWEIDYQEIPYLLKDENGKEYKPIMLIIAHPESLFIIDSHLIPPSENYIQILSDRIAHNIKNGPYLPRTIFLKKNQLADLLKKDLKGMNVKIEIVSNTKTTDNIRKDMNKYF